MITVEFLNINLCNQSKTKIYVQSRKIIFVHPDYEIIFIHIFFALTGQFLFFSKKNSDSFLAIQDALFGILKSTLAVKLCPTLALDTTLWINSNVGLFSIVPFKIIALTLHCFFWYQLFASFLFAISLVITLPIS